MSRKSLFGLALAGLIVPSSAGAVQFTLDFANFAGNSGETKVEGFIANPFGPNADIGAPVSLFGYSGSIANAVGGTLGTAPFAYLDGFSNTLPGGAGVCSDGISGDAECDPSSDDNVTSNEVLGMSFPLGNGQLATIESLSFRNADHGDSFANDATIDIFNSSDGSAQSLTLTNTITLADLGAAGVTPTLAAGDQIFFGYNNAEFYLSSAVVDIPDLAIGEIPLPGGLVLLLGGLGALAGLGARG